MNPLSIGGQSYVVKRRPARQPMFNTKRPLLSHLDIELTERCNNACSHCYINLPANDLGAKRRELTSDQWKDILRQAADLGALSVRFTGGEPLLRLDFADIYLFARRLGMQVIVFTNGRLITPALADLLARVPPLKEVEVSVYGMRSESYDAIAGVRGAFTEFRRGLDLLQERQIPFIVKSALFASNPGELAEFETWVASIRSMGGDPPSVLFLDLRTRRDSPDKNQRIAALRLPPEQLVAALARREDRYRKGMTPFTAGFLGPRGDRLFTCGAGETGCVDAYGVYQMCMPLRHPNTVYDLKHGTLRKALTEAFPRFRKARATNSEYLRRCARCFLKGLCEQCPGKSWSEHGTLDTPVEYLCQVAHAEACYLGLLSNGEQAWEVGDWQQRIENLAQGAGAPAANMPHLPVISTR
jgi:radical SAM protein with 4Fe4S-binding SPASM domain